MKHALRFAAEIEAAYTDDPKALARLAETVAPDVIGPLRDLVQPVPPDLFAALAPRPPETGVLALARRPSADIDMLNDHRRSAPAVFLDDPAHLGNVGAVVRVAAAAGAAAVITSGRHDPWDPAALRGSAGLHFALPVLRLDAPPETSSPLIAIDPEGEPFRPDALPTGAILAFGSERRGLSPALLDRADRHLALPMRDHVSSLNLATAVAAVLYAWRFAAERREAGASNS
ncbi:MAG: TrmH family RNA methyltransferase [Geminicoccaceae bacterium]